MYYRVGLAYTMWLTWILREVLHLCADAFHLCVSSNRKDSLTLKIGLEKIGSVAGRFVETVWAALFCNFVNFILTTVLQFNTSFGQAWNNYAGGFISDIWGNCAASGYMDEFGYSCISY